MYYALIIKANLSRGDTVLIHSIAGGVGQAALNIARFRGANVIVTCSNEKKRWVQSELSLPSDRILDSHSADFKLGVMQLTCGRGVDVIYPSLNKSLIYFL